MEFNVLYNSSTSLQNAILQILSEGKSTESVTTDSTPVRPTEPKNETDTPDNIFVQILDNNKAEPVRPISRSRRIKASATSTDNTTRTTEVPTDSPKVNSPVNGPVNSPVVTPSNSRPAQPLASKNKVLTATEIIYRAILNEHEHEDMGGGNKAETMINNILTGGDNGSTVANPKENLFEEIHEVAPSERAQMNIFSGGSKSNTSSPTSASGSAHVNVSQSNAFASALSKYRSTQSAVDAMSSGDGSDDSSSDHADLDPDPDTEEDDNDELKSQFKAINKNGTNFMAQKLDNEEEDDLEPGNGLSDSSVSSGDDDDFLDSIDPHHDDTSVDRKTNAKYIRLIKQFKSPAPKGSILGGAVSRPKTVALINAFPYILKANPEGSNA